MNGLRVYIDQKSVVPGAQSFTPGMRVAHIIGGDTTTSAANG